MAQIVHLLIVMTQGLELCPSSLGTFSSIVDKSARSDYIIVLWACQAVAGLLFRAAIA
jgi:hypothetical protein